MDGNMIIILYVKEQEKSKNFYRKVLGTDPVLDVPGMTEFKLGPGVLLGLMPEEGMAKILAGKTPHPASGNGIPRAELYLYRENLEESIRMADEAGAFPISPALKRDWGDEVAYFSDPDGHILAFARKLNP